jgi:glycosyltransferase involved in cell wall biosynthesis
MGARRVESLEAPTTHPPVRPSLRPARVVYVLANEGYGGTEIHLRQLVRGLCGEEFQQSVLLSTHEPMQVLAAQLREDGISVGSLPVTTRRIDLRHFVDLAGVIRARRPDIVHVQVPWPLGAKAVVLASRLAGARVVVSTEHSHAYHFGSVGGLRGRWLRALARLRFRLSDRVIAVSAAQNDSFREVLGVRSSKLTVIPNGTDVERYAPGRDGSTIRSELGVPSSAPVAGMVTCYAEYERAEDFIRAADHVAAALPAAHFFVVGDQHPGTVNEHATRMRADLEALAKAFSIGDRVHFLGFRTDMPQVMAALDVFVLPARYKTSPLVLREAMACELPVVATAAGGVPEVVVDGDNGHLVPPLDPPALAAAMQRVLSDKATAARMGKRGRRRIEELFTTAMMIDRTANLYRSLLERRRGRATFVPADGR